MPVFIGDNRCFPALHERYKALHKRYKLGKVVKFSTVFAELRKSCGRRQATKIERHRGMEMDAKKVRAGHEKDGI
jgi:hypothetical protein